MKKKPPARVAAKKKPTAPDFKPGVPDAQGRLHYSFDFPVILMHARINEGEPTLARLVGTQSISGDWTRDIAFERFAATLHMPSASYSTGSGQTRLGAMRSVVRLAHARELSPINAKLGSDTRLNTASRDSKKKLAVGELVLHVELPLDAAPTFFVVSFSCALLRSGRLEFTGTGTALNGHYAGMVIACCGPKTPAPPPCTVSIITTTRATATNTSGAMGFTGLVQTATSSAGHAFPAGNVTVGIKVWDNGMSMVRPGVIVPLAANGTLTYPTFGATHPITWGTAFPANAVVELTVTVTDVKGDVGTQDFARSGGEVP